MNEIEQIASKHLGKAGDGTVVAPYVTPDAIDASLLVAIPRQYNRTQYDIDGDDLPFIGADVWNCYEVSAMTANGYPVSGIIKLMYNAESECIVESKSLKLYLNSFNMCRVADTVEDAIESIEVIISHDLAKLLDTPVRIKMFTPTSLSSSNQLPSIDSSATRIESLVTVEHIKFDTFKESPGLLIPIDFDSEYEVLLSTNALRSNCRVTNQPDWGDLYIYIKGKSTIDPESLLKYIVSMRSENHFHEEIVECIIKRLIDLLPNCSIGVCALYTRRGGIDINPIRANSTDALYRFSDLLNVEIKHEKTDRQ